MNTDQNPFSPMNWIGQLDRSIGWVKLTGQVERKANLHVNYSMNGDELCQSSLRS